MRILLMANNWVGWKIACLVKEGREEVVGLVLHPRGQCKHREEIRQSVNVPEKNIFDASKLDQPEVIDRIRQLRPDVGLSIFFGYILRPPFLELFPTGVVNLHPAYLPYNRGEFPNVWSIIEGTPAGVTLHYLDAGIDTGDILAQKEVPVEPVDTGETLYHKLERASVELFRDAWPDILRGKPKRFPQDPQVGTHHRRRDVEKIDEIELDRTYMGRDLINVLRARTFPPYSGAYFRDGERKIYMRLQLSYGDHQDDHGNHD